MTVAVKLQSKRKNKYLSALCPRALEGLIEEEGSILKAIPIM
jgi:hypothetical protein